MRERGVDRECVWRGFANTHADLVSLVGFGGQGCGE